MALRHEAGDPISSLEQEHKRLDQAISALDKRVWLSPTEEAERKKLAKRKLTTKDRLAVLKSGRA